MVHKDARGNKYKTCSKCGTLKRSEEFWLDGKCRSRRRAACKVCEGEAKKTRRDQGPLRFLPAPPLYRVVEQAKTQYDVSWEELGKALNVSAKTFYEWRQDNRKSVNFDTADSIVTGLGLIWEDVFDAKTCERLRAAA